MTGAQQPRVKTTVAKGLGHDLIIPGNPFEPEVRCHNCEKLFFTGKVIDIVTKCPRCGKLQRIMQLP
jgi:Zn finger protein HypA/HybF involved in hydrogenase expression